MYIIKINTNNNGSRPALQSWSNLNPPKGYVLCPDEFYNIFYSTDPAGFVNIIIEHNIVTSMEVNQEALDAYVASLPEEPALEEDIIEDVSYDALAQAITEGVNDL